jgi:hypothetical protein
MVVMVHTSRPITEGSSEESPTSSFPDLVSGRCASDTANVLQILPIAAPSVKRSLSNFASRISYVSKHASSLMGTRKNILLAIGRQAKLTSISYRG